MSNQSRILILFAFASTLVSPATWSAEPIVCLITKTNTNPFFVKMQQGAEERAAQLGLKLQSYAGKTDGDTSTQIEAIESCVAAGAKSILLTPSDSRAIVPAVNKARDAGLMVVALDTPLEPESAADATFATDNFKAGELIGKWAAAQIDGEAKIALLDLNPSGISVDYLRDQGFLSGFGIDVKDPKVIGDEADPRIIGHDITYGSEAGGRTAMENLMQVDFGVNLVYTINEPAAAGAYEALKAAGIEKNVLIVSVDGGCPGVQNVRDGIIGATSMQFPLRMAVQGIEAVDTFLRTGQKPAKTPGLDFIDTGVELVTDSPVNSVISMSTKLGLSKCWG